MTTEHDSPSWRVILQREAKKQLRLQPPDVLKRISAALDEIGKNPYDGPQLEGWEYRKWRVGNLRIIYHIENDKLIVLIIDISHRRNVYQRLNR